MTNAQAMTILAAEMDRRDQYREILKSYLDNHGKLPPSFAVDYEKIKDEISWRKNKKIMSKLKAAARNFAKNENAKAAAVKPGPMPEAKP
jgi:dTDP-D-glucose 4,6-dehydratase